MSQDKRAPYEVNWEMIHAFTEYAEQPEIVERWENLQLFLMLSVFRAGYEAGENARD